MKSFLIPAALAVTAGFVMSPAPVSAKGCIKGAVIGGTAGHFAGHHGVLGAGAGCIIGHHEAKKHARERERVNQNGYGSSRSYGDQDPR